MTVEIDVSHRLGHFSLDARFGSEGRLTVLFGQSGSGKTSLVNLVGGLMRPDRGRIAVDGVVLVDTAERIFVPKHRRRVGYVFQDARLFPHMSVRRNLTYGHWFTPAPERYQTFERVVDLLGIEPILERRPGKLSGGERQRVAIGRALLASPRLLLMDEPLAALDEARKAEVMPYIERLRDETGIPILYVSHSVAEVMRLASDLVVLADGRVVASGEPKEVMGRLDLMPMAADIEAGAVIDTVVEDHDARFGLTLLVSKAGILRIPRIEAEIGTPVRIRIRARDVMIATRRPEDLSALNIFEGVIVGMADRGPSSLDVSLDCGGADVVARVTRQSAETLGLMPGCTVHAVVKTVSFERRAGAGRFGPDVEL